MRRPGLPLLRHVDRRFCYILDQVDTGFARVHHVRGERNPADNGTKNLRRALFLRCRRELNVLSYEEFLRVCASNEDRLWTMGATLTYTHIFGTSVWHSSCENMPIHF